MVKNAVPVNWPIYNPEASEADNFKVYADTNSFKEGRHSLLFDIKKCSSAGGRFSPGFSNEFFECGQFRGEGDFRISFWARNAGTTFRFQAGAVKETKGDMKTLTESNAILNDWTLFEYDIHIPKEHWLRIELNILQPGQFWIDDFRIQQI